MRERVEAENHMDRSVIRLYDYIVIRLCTWGWEKYC